MAGRNHNFEVSHESGALELVTRSEAEEWKTGDGSALSPGASLDLDQRIGRKVKDLTPGQNVSISGKELSLEAVKFYQRERFDNATILAIEKGPVAHLRYLLLEQDQRRVWVEATATDTVPVHEVKTISEKGFTAPRFSIRHITHVPLGERVSATGFKPSDNNRYQQTVTATGTLAGVHEKASGEYLLTISTAQGPVDQARRTPWIRP